MCGSICYINQKINLQRDTIIPHKEITVLLKGIQHLIVAVDLIALKLSYKFHFAKNLYFFDVIRESYKKAR